MESGAIDGRSVRERLVDLAVTASELDPEPTRLAELWAAVGAHVLESASTLGDAPAYTAPTGVAQPAFSLAESGAGIGEALTTIEHVRASGVNQTSGGHLAYIPGGGLFPAALGDLMADVANPYVGINFAAPAAAELERSLIRWMSGLVGYPETAGGDLTSGASVANLEGIVTARDAAEIRASDIPRTVVYLTSQTHHCIEKALRVSGLTECVVRRVDLDDRMRMRPEALDAVVRADALSGLRPWLVVATAGSTDTGAVDPLAAIADVADAHGLWFHVDAAYGGFFVLTAHGRHVLEGIERSRTVVMDPHKGLFLPFGSGALIVRDERQLAAAHGYTATYLEDVRGAGGVFSSSDLSVELSRPFRGLRMWLPLKLFGIAAFRAALEEKLLLARYFHSRLAETPEWLVGPEPDLSIVTYRYRPKTGDANDFNRRLLQAVVADGRTVISGTELDGAYTLRLAVLQYRTHLDHIEGVLEVLTREAERLASSG